MAEQPMVSVLIPTYNQEKFISKTIESVLMQRAHFNYEIIVGDDCSFDLTAQIVKKFESNYPQKVVGVYSSKNFGLMNNVRKLFSCVRGKYISLLGGDDYFSSQDTLSKQVEYLESNDDYVLVHSDVDYYYQSTGSFVKNVHSSKKQSIKTGYVFEDLLLKNFIFASSACFRAEAFKSNVNFDLFIELGFLMEDLPTWLELSRIGKFGYINESLVVYRVLFNSVSRPSNPERAYLFLENSSRISCYYAKKYGCSKRITEQLEIQNSRKDLAYGYLLKDRNLVSKAMLVLLKHESKYPLEFLDHL